MFLSSSSSISLWTFFFSSALFLVVIQSLVCKLKVENISQTFRSPFIMQISPSVSRWCEKYFLSISVSVFFLHVSCSTWSFSNSHDESPRGAWRRHFGVVIKEIKRGKRCQKDRIFSEIFHPLPPPFCSMLSQNMLFIPQPSIFSRAYLTEDGRKKWQKRKEKSKITQRKMKEMAFLLFLFLCNILCCVHTDKPLHSHLRQLIIIKKVNFLVAISQKNVDMY